MDIGSTFALIVSVIMGSLSIGNLFGPLFEIFNAQKSAFDIYKILDYVRIFIY